MTRKIISSAILATLALTACGGGSDSSSADTGSDTTSDSGSDSSSDASDGDDAAADNGAPNINTGGPGVCIDAAIKQLGPDAMINEINSYFEPGDDIDPPLIDTGTPSVPGSVTVCEAFYQDPSNPIKLLSIKMDNETGEFGEPTPVEINVIGGDASEFDLNDYVIKASEINTSVMQTVMDEKTPSLDETYSLWRWTGASLSAPGTFSDVHLFDMSIKGRLAANDITDTGNITIQMDGKVVDDYLE